MNLLFLFIRMNLEIRIASEHRGEVGFCLVVEDVAWDSETFGIGEFIADTERWAGAFANEEVAFTKPGCVLVVNI